MAITDPELARNLNAAAKARRVVDLSVPNSMNTPVAWPGIGIGNYAFPYHAVDPANYYTGAFGPYRVNTHRMDSRTGTHVSPPAHYGPPPGFDLAQYDEQTRGWLNEFQQRYGELKRTEMTSDKVPPHYFMGPARVINVQNLAGTTNPERVASLS